MHYHYYEANYGISIWRNGGRPRFLGLPPNRR